ncbi:MAG: hypothetical protein JWR74_1322, partial [Polaromonas sp.]|nr:hypothetical protein [Polaromonas sp.]
MQTPMFTRRFPLLALGIALGLTAAAPAFAQAYPSRLVTLVVPFP